MIPIHTMADVGNPSDSSTLGGDGVTYKKITHFFYDKNYYNYVTLHFDKPIVSI